MRVKVGRADDIPEGGSTVVPVGKKDLAVFRSGGAFYAIDDCCPHMGASLAGGYVEDGVVTCPWHYWRFRLSDGAWDENPKVGTGCYAVHVVGDELEVEVPDEGAAAQ
jgi:nitrite reductase (NADH) small subunit/3-phenylpropionate/trans-cinnamate dioxygenase ferredoxin subunit